MSENTANPWLEIKAEDYEGHMALPEVDQSAPLGRIFGEALIRSAAKKIALLGSATGNGIEAVDFDKIDKLYALDINPDFLDILKTRFSLNISKIEAIACDLDRDDPELSGIDLVFAALIFEYVDTEAVIEKVARWLKPEGVLVVVLQLPCKDIPEISPSPFKNLEKLSSIMKLVVPDDFSAMAVARGLEPLGKKVHRLRSGKEFCEMAFRASEP
jgi:ubiquinone/menaquinone biosynthesis C-methylase UbiE